jgi:osmotically-inducible protein OsmY
MKVGLLARSAEALEHELRAALSDPGIDASEIAIAVENGVVTLRGRVASLRAAVAAERAVTPVDGVRSVANALHVRATNERTDTDLAREALHRLRNNVAVPLTIQAVVHDGYIRLDGTVRGSHQKAAAEAAVRHLSGVKGVSNEILVAEGVER